MNYGAINAKVKAMGAKLLKPHDFETLAQMQAEEMDTETNLHQSIKSAAQRICLYIPNRDLRSFVEALSCPGDKDIHYYTTQWKRLARLDKANRQALRGILGAEIDLTNILWMYRLKRFRRVKGSSTYGYLIPIRYKLSRAVTQRMADCETPKALLEEVAHSPYARDIFITQSQKVEWQLSRALHERPNQGNRRLTPERQLTSAISKRYQISASRYPSSLAPALAYLYQKKLEVQKVIRIRAGGSPLL